MYLKRCALCSDKLLKEHNEVNNKYICSNQKCETNFEVMDVNKNDDQEEKIVKYYKSENNKGNDVEMISHCVHCNGSLKERCSMPTIGSRGKKRTTILTCSGSDCKAEYHVTDDIKLRERYSQGDISAQNFRTIEIY